MQFMEIREIPVNIRVAEYAQTSRRPQRVTMISESAQFRALSLFVFLLGSKSTANLLAIQLLLNGRSTD